MFLREVADMVVSLILNFSRYNCCSPSADAPSCNKSDNLMAESPTFLITEFHSLHCDVSYETGTYKVLG